MAFGEKTEGVVLEKIGAIGKTAREKGLTRLRHDR